MLTYLVHSFRLLISPQPYGQEEGTWGETRKCKKGSHAIGAEIALHDDYGLSNLQHIYEENPHYNDTKLWAYLASIINIRLFCSEDIEDKDDGDSSVIEGNLHNFWDGMFPNKCPEMWFPGPNVDYLLTVYAINCHWTKLLYHVQNRQKPE